MNIMPNDECPKCGKHINAAATVSDENAQPSSGDVTVCIGCAGILKFDDNLKLAKLTTEEFDEMDEATKDNLLQAVAIVESMRRG